MDGRKMDVEGGRVMRRQRRARKLAVVVVVQNVLVAACLLVTLYVHWGVQKQPPEDIIHIQFSGISDTYPNDTLPFDQIISSNMMSTADHKIYINCTGPYVLYMDVCYKSTEKEQLSATLLLKVAGRENPVSSFTLTTTDEDCRGLQSIAYLRAKEQASLRLYSQEGFKIKNATLGLSYLLGTKCRF